MVTKKTKTTKKKKTEKKIVVEDLLVELMARFDAIEEKLDTLVSKSAVLTRMISTERDSGFKTHATLAKKPPIPQDRPPRERKMYKAVCAECRTSCEVPFEPRSDRPVYCKRCYSNRRNDTGARDLPNREELVAEISKTLNIDMTKSSKPKAGKTKKTRAKASRAKKTKAKTSKAKKTKTKRTKAKK